jgi:hypothetical protein
MPPRRLTSHLPEGEAGGIFVEAYDDPGGPWDYSIVVPERELTGEEAAERGLEEGFYCEEYRLRFQRGVVGENGLNGITVEALLAIVIDRLEFYQRSPFPCQENAAALTHVRAAQTHLAEGLGWLHERTEDRIRRGVEGQEVT